MTETEVEALSLLTDEFLTPSARRGPVLDPEAERQDIRRLIAGDIVRMQAEYDELQALLCAYEERWEQAEPSERPGLEATEGKALAAKASAHTERLARWEEAARELCRAYGVEAPPPARESPTT